MSERPTKIRLREGSPPDEYRDGLLVAPPGDAWLATNPYTRQDGSEVFAIACPGCGIFLTLPTWTLTRNSDGTVTVRPSVIHTKHQNYDSAWNGCGAHFHITENRIDWC